MGNKSTFCCCSSSALEKGTQVQGHRASLSNEESKEKKDKKSKKGQKRKSQDDAGVEEDIHKRLVQFEMTQDAKNIITKTLESDLVCFQLETSEIAQVVSEMKLYEFEDGACITLENKVGSHFFIIHQGQAQVEVKGSVVSTMTAGKAFGEVALIQSCPRTSTVTAVGETLLWAVDRKTFQGIIQQSEKRSYKENRAFINSVQLLEGLTREQLDMLVEMAVTTQIWEAGSRVITQGEKGDSLYIVKSGQLSVLLGGTISSTGEMVGGEKINTLSEGQCFGERALLYGEPRSATVVAEVQSVLLFLGREHLMGVLGEDLAVILRNNLLFHSLRKSKVVSQLSQAQRAAIIRSMENLTFEARQTVTNDIRYFVVVEGIIFVDQSISLNRGTCFGDDYIEDFSKPCNCKFTAGPKGCRLAALSSEGLRKAFQDSSFAEGTSLAKTLNFNAKIEAARKVWMFRHLTEAQIRKLAKVFESMILKKGDQVIKQGDPGDKFFVIARGEVDVKASGKFLRSMTPYGHFGERALLFNEARSATVVVKSDEAEFWYVVQSAFEKIVSSNFTKHLSTQIWLQDRNITFDELTKGPVIGKGAFGKVRLATHRKTGMRYALKCVKKELLVEQEMESSWEQECEVIKTADHPFIVAFVGAFENQKLLYLLTELVTGGDLYNSVVKKMVPLNDRDAMFYVGSLFLAIEHLNKLSIVYRDLKPENALLDPQGYLKLIDFGTSKKLTEGKTYSVRGTPHYMAPEMIRGKGYGLSVDFWALGVILFAFCSGELPFGTGTEDQFEVCKQVLKGEIKEDLLPDDHVPWANLVHHLLEPRPERRLGSRIVGNEDIRNHPFFTIRSSAPEESYLDRLMSRSVDPPFVPPAFKVPDEDGEGELSEDDSECTTPHKLG